MFAKQLPESLIKGLSIQARELHAVNLGQGIPSFPTALHILDAARQSLTDETIGVYPNFLGELALREALADRLNGEHPGRRFSKDNVLVTVGAMEGTAAAILSVVSAGDTVAVITPDYCNHEPQILLAKANMRAIPMRETETRWELDRQAVEQAVSDGVSMIVYTSPNNPTGAVFQEDDIAFMVGLAKAHDIWILSDETYDFLTYGTRHVSLLAAAGGYDKALVVRSFSKEYAMTGWRVGYVVADETVLPSIAKTHDALTGCAPKISQRAAYAALTGPQTIVDEYRSAYASRRTLVVARLSEIPGLSCAPPEGAYYAFPRYDGTLPSVELSEKLLREAGVAVVPGSAFGAGGQKHFRISFGASEEVLEEGIRRIRSYLSGGNTAA